MTYGPVEAILDTAAAFGPLDCSPNGLLVSEVQMQTDATRETILGIAEELLAEGYLETYDGMGGTYDSTPKGEALKLSLHRARRIAIRVELRLKRKRTCSKACGLCTGCNA